MIAQRRAEHVELALVPATHEIEAETPFADMIGRDEFLGGDERMKERRVNGAEHGHAPRIGEKRGRPGDGLQRRTLVIRIAAIAAPARDRQHEVDPRLVRDAREAQIIVPAPGPALGHHRHRAPRRAVGAEEPDLQPVPIMKRRALAARCVTDRHDESSAALMFA
jgi:hypothetical protein